MRIAIVSDIHGNLPAFTSTLSRIDTLAVDAIYCLGDILGYGPFPNECVDLVRERCTVVIKGNHDCGVTGETPLSFFNEYGREAIIWTNDRITEQNRTYVEELEYVWLNETLTLVHASPDDPPAWTYVFTWREARDCFSAFATDLCFIGHTHVPVVVGEDSTINTFRRGVRFVINVGSVGQPRDGNPQASFGLLDTEQWTYECVRVDYDIEQTARAIRENGLPLLLGERLFRGA